MEGSSEGNWGRKMRVGVLGSGASGLAGIRVCLEYGFQPVCFEKAHDIGGLWRYKSQETQEASVMKSTVINTSKEMMAYSDFPPSKEFPNFMHNTRVMDYFRQYVHRFGLDKYIRFHTEILSVSRAPDYSTTGRWIVSFKDLKSGETGEETLDAVLLCTGHHAEPYVAQFKGMENFKGKVRHSHSYKDHVGFEDKRVIVIGVGNSGGDIAVELSRISSQVYWVTRRGTWVFNRVGDNGYPLDALFSTRFLETIKTNTPTIAATVGERKLNSRFDHQSYGLKPAHGVFQAHPTVNDEIPNRILCGTIVVKPNIREFTETGAIFEDGTKVEDIDEVVICTGYSFGFPYLEKGVIEVNENEVELFKYMFPPDLPHPTIAVIGLIQPLGAIMPISELQCRVFCDLLTGASKLPKKYEMKDEIEAKKKAMAQRYVKSRRHTIQVDYIPYMDELAKMIGAKPDVRKTFLRDPVLGFALVFGPCAPYQYRLVGPNPWIGARDALLSIWDRIFFPTQSSVTPPRAQKHDSTRNAGIILLLLLIAVLFFFIL